MSTRIQFIALLTATALNSGCVTSQVSTEHATAFKRAETVRFIEKGCFQILQVPGVFVDEGGHRVASYTKYAPTRHDSARVVPFTKGLLEGLGFKLVEANQKADVTVMVSYGSITWKEFVPVEERLGRFGLAEWGYLRPFKERFWCEVNIDCPHAKTLQRLYMADADIPDAKSPVQDAFEKSQFKEGLSELFGALCGSERVAQSIKKIPPATSIPEEPRIRVRR